MQHCDTSDGVSIAYRDMGKGRPLLLLHGLMAHGGFFEKQHALQDEFRLLIVDLRGHGGSPARGTPPTLQRLSDDVAELLAHLDLAEIVGVGWSLGASVLWHLLGGSCRDRFAGAVIIDMTPCVLNDGEWTLGLSREICEARSVAIRDDFPAFAAAAGQAIFAGPLPPSIEPLARWSSEEFARNDANSISALWSSLVEADFRDRLQDIVQPTLVVHGGQSHLYGTGTADHLVTALPNARAIRLDQSGHAPHMEQPELFNGILRQFAAGLPHHFETAPTPNQA